MTLFVQRVLDGLADGSLFGALALALTIVYQGTGRLNLAQGEMGTIGTYVALVLSSSASSRLAGTGLARQIVPFAPWPTWLAAVGAVALSAAIGGLLERFLVRRVADRPVGSTVRVTVALLMLANAWATMTWSRSGSFPSLFPSGPEAYLGLAGARLRVATIGMWAVLLALYGLLWLASRRTRAGLAFRSVAQAAGASALVGIRVRRVWMGSWALAAAIGTLVGILSASRLVLSPDMMVRLLVYGFVAAALGGFSRPGGALIGGLVVGVGQALIGGYAPFTGETLSFPLIVVGLIVLLVVRPSITGGGGGSAELVTAVQGLRRSPEPGWRSALVRSADGVGAGSSLGWVRWLGRAGVLAVVAALPAWYLPVVHARTWVQLVGTVVAFAGLAVLLGPAGGLSLGHAAFMGVGAYTVGIAGRYGIHPLVGVGLAALVGAAAGVAVGFPALRIRGQYLAVITFCVAVVLPNLVTLFRRFTGGDLGPPLISIPAGPSWFPDGGRDHTWFHVVALAVAALTLAGVHRLLGGAWGRALRATTDDAQAAASMGVPVARIRTSAFALATALGAMGGALVAVPQQAVTGSILDPFRSLAAFALVLLCGVDSLAGAALAAVLFVGTPWFLSTTGWALGAQGIPPDATGGGAYLLWGLGLLVGTLVVPDGIVPALRRLMAGARGGAGLAADAGAPTLAGASLPG
ncbi:MAG: ABC transporter permease [Acidimicrobiales bacterium]